jgi:hypothetical protein
MQLIKKLPSLSLLAWKEVTLTMKVLVLWHNVADVLHYSYRHVIHHSRKRKIVLHIRV